MSFSKPLSSKKWVKKFSDELMEEFENETKNNEIVDPDEIGREIAVFFVVMWTTFPSNDVILDDPEFAKHTKKIMDDIMDKWAHVDRGAYVLENNEEAQYPMIGFHRYHNHYHNCAPLRESFTKNMFKKIKNLASRELMDDEEILHLGDDWLVKGVGGNVQFLNFDNYLKKQFPERVKRSTWWTDKIRLLRQREYKKEIIHEIPLVKDCEMGNGANYLRKIAELIRWFLWKNKISWTLSTMIIQGNLVPNYEWKIMEASENKSYSTLEIMNAMMSLPKYGEIFSGSEKEVICVFKSIKHCFYDFRNEYIEKFYKKEAKITERLYDIKVLMI